MQYMCVSLFSWNTYQPDICIKVHTCISASWRVEAPFKLYMVVLFSILYIRQFPKTWFENDSLLLPNKQTNTEEWESLCACLMPAQPASQPTLFYVLSISIHEICIHPSRASHPAEASSRQSISLLITHTHTHTLFRQTQLEAWKRKGEKSSSIIPSSAQTYRQTDRQTLLFVPQYVGGKGEKVEKKEEGKKDADDDAPQTTYVLLSAELED